MPSGFVNISTTGFGQQLFLDAAGAATATIPYSGEYAISYGGDEKFEPTERTQSFTVDTQTFINPNWPVPIANAGMVPFDIAVASPNGQVVAGSVRVLNEAGGLVAERPLEQGGRVSFDLESAEALTFQFTGGPGLRPSEYNFVAGQRIEAASLAIVSPNGVRPGQPVSVTVTGSGPVPSGSVRIRSHSPLGEYDTIIALDSAGAGTGLIRVEGEPERISVTYLGDDVYGRTRVWRDVSALVATNVSVQWAPTILVEGQLGTAVVTVAGSGASAPTGTVSMTNRYGRSTALLVDGVARISDTAAPGEYVFAYEGDTIHAPSTLTVTPPVRQQTFTTLTTPDVAWAVGDTVSFVANVTNGNGSPVTDGFVEFTVDGVASPRVAITSGKASFSLVLADQNNFVTARFVGTDLFGSSWSNQIERRVSGRVVTMWLSTDRLALGSPSQLTAYLSVYGVTGSVSFFAVTATGEVNLGSAPVENQSASIEVTPDASWTSIRATYSGDGSFGPATVTWPVVAKWATELRFTGPGRVRVGESAQIVVTVANALSTAPPVTGSVRLPDGNVVALDANGSASFTITPTSSYPGNVEYLGDDSHLPVNDTVAIEVFDADPNFTVDWQAIGTAQPGSSVRVPFNVNGWPGPTGTVTASYADSTGSRVVLASANVRDRLLSFVLPDAAQVTFEYSGDSRFLAATIVKNLSDRAAAEFNVEWQNAAAAQSGDTVTVPFTLTGTPTPTGTVTATFVDSAGVRTVLASVDASAGQLSFVVPATTAVTFTYSGDSVFGAVQITKTFAKQATLTVTFDPAVLTEQSWAEALVTVKGPNGEPVTGGVVSMTSPTGGVDRRTVGPAGSVRIWFSPRSGPYLFALEDNDYAAQPVTVTPTVLRRTVTTLTTPDVPWAIGDTVSVTATVADADGNAIENGFVEFYVDGARSTRVAITNGQALFSHVLTDQNNIVNARFVGTDSFGPSWGNEIARPVSGRVLTMSLATERLELGTPSQLSAYLSAYGVTGSVSFFAVTATGEESLGSAPVQYQSATIEVTPDASWMSIRATYSGDSIFGPVTITGPVLVKWATDIAFVGPSRLRAGESAQFVVTVSNVRANGPAVTGNLRLPDLSVVPLDAAGSATFTITPTSSYPGNVEYLGDASHYNKVVTISVEVFDADPGFAVDWQSVDNALPGNRVTVPFTFNGWPSPTGTVTASYVNSAGVRIVLATVDAQDDSIGFDIPNTQQILFSYSGDTRFVPAQTTKVIPALATLQAVFEPSVLSEGTSAVAVVSVTGPNGVAVNDGYVRLSGPGDVYLGQSPVSNGTSRVYFTPRRGPFVFTLEGNDTYRALPLTLTPTVRRETVIALASPTDPWNIGETVQVEATVTETGGASVPSGTIEFFVDGTSKGTTTVNTNGKAVISFEVANATNAVQATFTGDAVRADSQSDYLVRRIVGRPFGMTLASESFDAGVESSIGVNFAVAGPTGSVEFAAISPAGITVIGTAPVEAGYPLSYAYIRSVADPSWTAIRATYIGDTNFAPFVLNTPVTVKNATTLTVTGPARVRANTPTTFTAKVTSTRPSSEPITGKIVDSFGQEVTVGSDGTAEIVVTTESPWLYFEYRGDASYHGSSGRPTYVLYDKDPYFNVQAPTADQTAGATVRVPFTFAFSNTSGTVRASYRKPDNSVVEIVSAPVSAGALEFAMPPENPILFTYSGNDEFRAVERSVQIAVNVPTAVGFDVSGDWGGATPVTITGVVSSQSSQPVPAGFVQVYVNGTYATSSVVPNTGSFTIPLASRGYPASSRIQLRYSPSSASWPMYWMSSQAEKVTTGLPQPILAVNLQSSLNSFFSYTSYTYSYYATATFAPVVTVWTTDVGGSMEMVVDGQVAETVPVTFSNGTAAARFSQRRFPVGYHTVEWRYSGSTKARAAITTQALNIERQPLALRIETAEFLPTGSSQTAIVSAANMSVPLAGTLTLVRNGVTEQVSLGQPVTIDTSVSADQSWTVSYAGDANYLAASTTATVKINSITATHSVTANPSTIDPGQSTTVTVRTTLSNGATPNGVVKIRRGTLLIGEYALVNSEASFQDSPPSGYNSYNIEYIGEPAGVRIVNDTYGSVYVRKQTAIGRIDTLSPAALGSAPTILANFNLDSTAGYAVLKNAEGTVVNQFCTATSAGWSCRTPVLTATNTVFTIEYAGNNRNMPASKTFTITAIEPPQITVTPFGAAGDRIYANVTVTGTGRTPTGTVYVQIGGVAMCCENDYYAPYRLQLYSGTRTVNSTATFRPGPNTVYVSYSGDSLYPGAVYEATYIARGKVDVTTSLESPTAIVGDPVVATATVIPTITGGATPTGIVEFRADGIDPIQVPVDGAGQATASIRGLRLGANNLSVYYVGDDVFAPAVGAATATVLVPFGLRITPSTLTGPAPLAVSFAVSSIRPTGTSSAVWDFGDNTTASTLNATHLYNSPGTYNAKVSVTASNGSVETEQIAVVVEKTTPTVVVSDVSTPRRFGEAVTLNVTLDGLRDSATPTGSFTVFEGTIQKVRVSRTTNAQIISVVGLPTGSHQLRVTYSGDANYTTVDASFTVDVTTQNVSVELDGPAAPVNAGSTQNLSVRVVADGAGSVPSGRIRVTQPGAADRFVALNALGNATVPLTTSTAGSQGVTVFYEGDTNHTAADATFTYTVIKAPTTISLTAAPDVVVVGDTLTLTATVTVPNQTTIAAGTVRFFDGNTEIGTVTLNANGTATLAVQLTNAGVRSFTATYDGSALLEAATTSAVPVNVKRTVEVAIAPVPPSVFGAPVTVTVTVTPSTGTATVTGTVILRNERGTQVGSGPLGTGNKVSFVLSGIVPGIHKFTAYYGGSTVFAAAVSDQASIEISRSVSAITVSTPNAVVSAGDATSFTATMGTVAFVRPTGFVVFTIDGADQAPVALVNGKATFTTDALTLGAHSVTARYGGDSVFEESSAPAPPVNVDVRRRVVVDVEPVVPVMETGQTIVINTTVTSDPAGSPGTVAAPTGQVVFVVDGTPTTPLALNADGEATLTATGWTLGVHTVSVRYLGDTTYASRQSVWKTQEIVLPFDVQVSASRNTGTVPFTTTFSAGAAQALTGATITWTFGDGTTATGQSVTHTFADEGSYVVSVTASRNGQNDAGTMTVEAVNAPLVAVVASDEVRTVEGVEVDFDASASTGPVRRVEWDFGDGTTATGYAPKHTYAVAGVYLVNATVYGPEPTGGVGLAPSSTTRISSIVLARSNARLKVATSSGALISGADLVLRPIKPGNTIQFDGTTSAAGEAVLPALEKQDYDVYVYAEGFEPKRVALSLPPDPTEPDVTITLTAGSVATAKFAKPEVLTPAQIVSAGIDTSKPENRVVQEYRLDLGTATGIPVSVTACVNALSEPVPCPVAPNDAQPVTSAPSGPVSSGSNGGGPSSPVRVSAAKGQVFYTTVTKDSVQVLWVPLEGSFIKEFFNTRLFVYNRASQPGFVLKAGSAQLSVPKTNMTVLSNRIPGAKQTGCVAGRVDDPASNPAGYPERVNVSEIGPGQCAEIDWIVRGDVRCSCILNAIYDSVLEPFDRVVHAVATSEPFVVYGAEALAVRAELRTSDGLTSVAGQENTFDVPEGVTIDYTVYAGNTTTDRTLRGIQLKYPATWFSPGELADLAYTSDKPLTATIDELKPATEIEAGTLTFVALKAMRITFPTPLANIVSTSQPGIVVAPRVVVSGKIFDLVSTDDGYFFEWDAVENAASYVLHLSETNKITATSIPISNTTSVGGRVRYRIADTLNLGRLKIAQLVTVTSDYPSGARFHPSYVVRGIAPPGSGSLAVRINRIVDDAQVDRVYEVRVTLSKAIKGVRYDFTFPSNHMPTVSLVATGSTIELPPYRLVNPRGVFKGEVRTFDGTLVASAEVD